MKKGTTIFLSVLLLLLGIGVLAYPSVSNYINKRNGSYAIEQLHSQLLQTEDAELKRQRRMAEAYNADLLTGSMEEEEQQERYNGTLHFTNGMMGSIQIPQIDVDLPIYHGISEEVLTKGVGHMPNSAFPIGGEGNHSVLTGHTGLPSAELFTDLTELSEGDRFYIRILEETLTYEVDQIKVVLPTDGSDILPVAGEDYCTLVTCTPYGVNSHRLLVRGRRLIEAQQESVPVLEIPEEPAFPAGWVITAAGAAVLMTVMPFLMNHKKQKK